MRQTARLRDREMAAVLDAVDGSPAQLDSLVQRVFERIRWASARRRLTLAELHAVLGQRACAGSGWPGDAVNDAPEARIRGCFGSVFKVGMWPADLGGSGGRNGHGDGDLRGWQQHPGHNQLRSRTTGAKRDYRRQLRYLDMDTDALRVAAFTRLHGGTATDANADANADMAE